MDLTNTSQSGHMTSTWRSFVLTVLTDEMILGFADTRSESKARCQQNEDIAIEYHSLIARHFTVLNKSVDIPIKILSLTSGLRDFRR